MLSCSVTCTGPCCQFQTCKLKDICSNPMLHYLWPCLANLKEGLRSHLRLVAMLCWYNSLPHDLHKSAHAQLTQLTISPHLLRVLLPCAATSTCLAFSSAAESCIAKARSVLMRHRFSCSTRSNGGTLFSPVHNSLCDYRMQNAFCITGMQHAVACAQKYLPRHQ